MSNITILSVQHVTKENRRICRLSRIFDRKYAFTGMRGNGGKDTTWNYSRSCLLNDLHGHCEWDKDIKKLYNGWNKTRNVWKSHSRQKYHIRFIALRKILQTFQNWNILKLSWQELAEDRYIDEDMFGGRMVSKAFKENKKNRIV